MTEISQINLVQNDRKNYLERKNLLCEKMKKKKHISILKFTEIIRKVVFTELCHKKFYMIIIMIECQKNYNI